MKTAEQKIDEIFSTWVRDSQTLEQLERRIVQALREQDRDTRHACAEAVIKLARTVSQCSTVEYCKGFNDAIVSAHDACMNVQDR